jgi:hypothetical protein
MLPQDYDWAEETLRAVRDLLAALGIDQPPPSLTEDTVRALASLRLRYIPELVQYELDGWSALYADGKLWQAGDSYLADERVGTLCGVEHVHDQAELFRVGGSISRSTIPHTRGELRVRAERRRVAKERADALRAEADKLVAEAEKLDPTEGT